MIDYAIAMRDKKRRKQRNKNILLFVILLLAMLLILGITGLSDYHTEALMYAN